GQCGQCRADGRQSEGHFRVDRDDHAMMKRLFAFLILLLCGQAFGAIQLLSGANGHQLCSAGSSCTTSSVDITGATLIVITTAYDGTPTGCTVSDSKSNTWTGLTTYTGGLDALKIYYAVNPTVGTGHTFTCSGSFPTCGVSLYSGTLTTSAVFD